MTLVDFNTNPSDKVIHSKMVTCSGTAVSLGGLLEPQVVNTSPLMSIKIPSFKPFLSLSGTYSPHSDHIDIRNEISIRDWKDSLDYSENQINDIISRILDDYGFPNFSYYIQWFSGMVNNLIEYYQNQYTINLDNDTKRMIRNLIVKMSFDKLCVKHHLN